MYVILFDHIHHFISCFFFYKILYKYNFCSALEIKSVPHEILYWNIAQWNNLIAFLATILPFPLYFVQNKVQRCLQYYYLLTVSVIFHLISFSFWLSNIMFHTKEYVSNMLYKCYFAWFCMLGVVWWKLLSSVVKNSSHMLLRRPCTLFKVWIHHFSLYRWR